ncbi:MAG: DUF6263 family protein [Isosphaeraceae bacterium]
MKMRRAGSSGWLLMSLGLSLIAAPETVQAQVKLEYKFREGQAQTYKSTVKTTQVLTLMGQEIPTDATETIVSSQKVGAKRSDGTIPVEDKVESLAVELALPMGIMISFDSKNPDNKVDNPQLAVIADIYKLISQVGYTVVLDAQNKVKAIEGAEKILEQADKLNDAAKQSIRSRLDAQQLKKQFQESHGNLPDVLARKGEPWERDETLDIGSGQTLSFHKKYEYVGEEKKDGAMLDKIAVKTTEVKYAMDPNSPSPLKVIKSELKVDSGDGVMLFDREAGRVVSASNSTRIRGPMTFAAGGQEIPGELDLTISTTTELQPAGR